MTKRNSGISFPIDLSGSEPLHQQLYEQLRQAILNGLLSPGFALPSTRRFAKILGVSRTTVVDAYDQLMAEGYLESKAGSGTYVAEVLPDDSLPVRVRELNWKSTPNRPLPSSGQYFQQAWQAVRPIR